MSTLLKINFGTAAQPKPEYRDIRTVDHVAEKVDETGQHYPTMIKFKSGRSWLFHLPPHLVSGAINHFRALDAQEKMQRGALDFPLGRPSNQARTCSYILEFDSKKILCHAQISDAATPWKITTETYPITLETLAPRHPGATPRAPAIPQGSEPQTP